MGIVQSRDELEYLLQHIGYYIGDLVDCVLEDSFEDPEYSAVTANIYNLLSSCPKDVGLPEFN